MRALALLLWLPLQGEDRPPALEDVLVELRATRDRALEELEPAVSRSVARLEALGARRPRSEYRELRAELAAYGPPATPLLVRHLDPGPEAGTAELFRAAEVADLLASLPVAGIVDDLLAHLDAGTLPARVHAARLLGAAPPDPRVPSALRAAWESEDVALRGAALASLARIGDEESRALVAGALSSARGELAAAALRALADVKAAGAADAVRKLARDFRRAGPQARLVLDYFLACPQQLGFEEILLLLDLVRSREAAPADRIAILRGLYRFGLPSSSKVKNLLDEIAASSRGTDVEEQALVTLALLGERNARRRVLEPYEDAVRESEGAATLRARGEILLRLEDHRRAARDLEEAIALLRERSRDVQEELVLLARAYARLGRERDAAQALTNAGLTATELLRLSRDPDFTELAASSRYGGVFPTD